MAPEVLTRLLASMHAGRLVVVCGAGLSMAPPSSLPSARAIAEACFDKYQLAIDPNCDGSLRENLEALAERFVAMQMLESVFIESLVPWEQFVRPSNPGHAAVADFLATRTAFAALSSNYDILIERRAWDYGAQFESALNGSEAMKTSQRHAPLLKFHGCSHRNKGETIWAPSQLNEPATKTRLESCTTWMAANLLAKDLLVVGFWSDWGYLNSVIGGALADAAPLSITIMDPSPPEVLQSKAPDLWALSQAGNITFNHVQQSGSDALDELRQAFSTNFLRQVLAQGISAIEAHTGAPCDPSWLEIPALSGEGLYDLRRDAEGEPRTRPARKKSPDSHELLGYFHLLMRRAGGQQAEDGYDLNGQKVRVVNGASQVLSHMRSRFVEAPVASPSDIVVAVGATDLGVPANVVREGRAGDLVRPAPLGDWYDLERAIKELSL